MAQPPSDWKGLTLASGRYAVLAKLGEGGMGYVFRATDRNLDTEVVIKVPRRAMLEDPEFASRFAREVRSLVKLSHPCVVKVTDVGEHDGVPFAVMQYLSGGSLEDYRPDGPAGATAKGQAAANVSEVGDWLPGIAAALDFVHSQGYVHRDVKPGNILFDAHGHVYLSDFGVAKVLGHAHEPKRAQTAQTGTGMVLGTPEYMAPELVMGRPFDGRIDQYALAVTVYEMLSGQRPFDAPSPTAILVLQTTQEPTPLRAVAPRVPQGLSDAVARALAKDPARRFPTCAGFAEAVVGFAGTMAPAGASELSPTGRVLRADQVRFPCPVCQSKLILPARLVEDGARVKGKEFTCPSCKSRLRVNDHGDGLLATEHAAAPGSITPTLKTPQRGSQTVREPSPRTPAATVLQPQPAAPRTLIEPLAIDTSAPHAVLIDPDRKRLPVWLWPAVGASAVVVLTASVTAAVLLAPRAPVVVDGRAKIDVSGLPKDALITLDRVQYDPSQFEGSITLAPTPREHDLAVNSAGFKPFRKSFKVDAGRSVNVKVSLEPVPTPEPPKVVVEKPKPKPKDEEKVEPPPAPPRLLAARKTNLMNRAANAAKKPSVTFDPIPQAAPAEADLAELRANPDSFANKVVVVHGLYVIGKGGTKLPDGTVWLTVDHANLTVAGPKQLAALRAVEAPVVTEVDPLLANHLSGLNALRVAPGPTARTAQAWGDSASVLTFHIKKRVDNDGERWTPVLSEIEFITGLNFSKLSEKNFRNAVQTLSVTPTGQNSGVSPRKDWSVRLGASYIAHLRRLNQQLKSMEMMHMLQVPNTPMNTKARR